jgi:hypothetical protein
MTVGHEASGSDDSHARPGGQAQASSRINNVRVANPVDFDKLKRISRSGDRGMVQQQVATGWSVHIQRGDSDSPARFAWWGAANANVAAAIDQCVFDSLLLQHHERFIDGESYGNPSQIKLHFWEFESGSLVVRIQDQ